LPAWPTLGWWKLRRHATAAATDKRAPLTAAGKFVLPNRVRAVLATWFAATVLPSDFLRTHLPLKTPRPISRPAASNTLLRPSSTSAFAPSSATPRPVHTAIQFLLVLVAERQTKSRGETCETF